MRINDITIITLLVLLSVGCGGRGGNSMAKSGEQATHAERPTPPKIVSSKPLSRCYPGECEVDAPDTLRNYMKGLEEQKIELFVRLNEYTPIIEQAITELDRFSLGERKYYPVKETKEALQVLAHDQGYFWNHGWEPYDSEDLYPSEAYFFRLYEQAVRLSPRIDLLAHFCSSDGRIGIINYSEWNPDPLYSMMIYRRGESLFLRMIGKKGEVNITDTYPLTDTKGRSYYLLSNNLRTREIAEEDKLCYLPTTNLFRQFLYEDVDGEMVLRCSMEQMPFDEPADGQKIVFNQKNLCWNICERNGKYYHQIEGTPTLHLTLDGANSKFTLTE